MVPVLARAAFARGEDVPVTLTLAPAQSVTGWNVMLYIRAQVGDATPLATVVLSISDSTNGVFTGTIPSADSVGLSPGLFYYSAERTDSGNRTTLAEGPLTLLASQGA
jgi:hypothetical protein